MELIPGSKQSKVEEKEKSVRVLLENCMLRRRDEFKEGTLYRDEAGARTSPGEVKRPEARRSWKLFSLLAK